MLLKIFIVIFVLLAVGMTGMLVKLAADSRKMTVTLGIEDGLLMPCPDTPNCVSSDALLQDSHYIAPIADADGSRWAKLVARLSAMEGAELVAEDTGYARFLFLTPLLGFADDVEFHRRQAQGEIAVRSASRVGRGDMNANRKRVDAIRAIL